MADPKVQVTCRIGREPAGKLFRMADNAGLSVNQVASALIERALAEGWTVRPGAAPAAVTETEAEDR